MCTSKVSCSECWSITESEYAKKRKEYLKAQEDLQRKINQLKTADEEYYITAEYLLALSNKAKELFESSEIHQKREIIKLVFQNLTLDGKTVRYEMLNPFDKIAYYADRSLWLPRANTTRIKHWLKGFLIEERFYFGIKKSLHFLKNNDIMNCKLNKS